MNPPSCIKLHSQQHRRVVVCGGVLILMWYNCPSFCFKCLRGCRFEFVNNFEILFGSHPVVADCHSILRLSFVASLCWAFHKTRCCARCSYTFSNSSVVSITSVSNTFNRLSYRRIIAPIFCAAISCPGKAFSSVAPGQLLCSLQSPFFVIFICKIPHHHGLLILIVNTVVFTVTSLLLKTFSVPDEEVSSFSVGTAMVIKA